MCKWLLLATIMVGTIEVNAQFEIHAFGGGNLADRFNVNGGQARVDGSGLFGVSGWYELPSGIGFELEYMQQRTTAEVNSSFLIDSDIPLNLHYLLAGGHWLFAPNDKVRTNLGLKGGVTAFQPRNDRYNTSWSFTVAGNAGVKYYITPNFGLRAQVHLLIPMQFGTGVFWGGNGGSGAGVTTFTTITQLGGIVGAFFAF